VAVRGREVGERSGEVGERNREVAQVWEITLGRGLTPLTGRVVEINGATSICKAKASITSTMKFLMRITSAKLNCEQDSKKIQGHISRGKKYLAPL